MLRTMWMLLRETVQEWQQDKVPMLAAALAYYTTFSLAPLLIIAIAIAGSVFGEDAARGQIVTQIQGLVGRQGAEAIEALIHNAYQPGTGLVATLISVATLFIGATGLFGQLQEALNLIWNVEPKPNQGVKGLIVNRTLSFAMVVVIGFLLLVSLVVSTLLSAIGNYFSNLIPGFTFLWNLVNFGVSFGVVTLLFALIYKVLPDAKVTWKDVGIGAIATALLFNLGKALIGAYLGSGAVGSAYGAAGSLVIVLVWVYYSAQILLFGAEFTQVYASHYGSRIVPTSHSRTRNSSEPPPSTREVLDRHRQR